MIATRFYLDQINPLRGLGQKELIQLFDQSQRGYYSRLQWLYHHIEKRDPMVRATKRRLLAALGGLDWNIKLVDTGDDETKKAAAQKQAETLRAAYDKIPNLRKALNFLCLADLRGFSHLEKIYAGAAVDSGADAGHSKLDPWDIIELRIVEQWFWCKQGYYGDWQYNRDAVETNRGEPIDPKKFIIREVEDPADEIFAELAVKRRVNDQDWDGFLEDYGVPPMFIVGPPNVPQDKEKEYQRVAEDAVSRRRGYLPNGAALESPSAGGAGGSDVFKERLDYIDQEIVVAGTSGMLTILAVSGSGTLAGEAQKEAFDEIAGAISQDVATVMQEQFDKPFLARVHPNEPVLAYFDFEKTEPERVSEILKDAQTAAEAGFAMDEEDLSEKTGYKMKFVGLPKGGPASPNMPVRSGRVGEEPAKPGNGESPNGAAATSPRRDVIASGNVRLGGEPAPAQPAAPDPEQLNSLLQSGLEQFFQAEAADLEPLRRALEAAIADPTPEKLQALLDQLPELQDKLGTSSADVLRNILGTALAQGLSS